VLGPLLFIVYTADLAAVAQKHNVTVHAFADDALMYLHCSCHDTTSPAVRLELCIADVGQCCPLIVSSSIRTRQSYCGSERGTVCLNMALFLRCNSVLTQSRLTTSVFLELRLRRILASIGTSLWSAHHVSTDYDNFDVLGVRWTRRQRRHLYTRLLPHVSTTVRP